MAFLQRIEAFLSDTSRSIAEKREHITRQYAFANAAGAAAMAVFFAWDKWEPLVGIPIFICIAAMLAPVFWRRDTGSYLVAQIIFFAAMYSVIVISALYLGSASNVHLFAILLFIMLLLLVGFERKEIVATAFILTAAILSFPLWLQRPGFMPMPPADHIVALTRTIMDVLFFTMLTVGFSLFAALLAAEKRALQNTVNQKQELVRIVAHDIQNPANAALQYARMVENSPAAIAGVLAQLARLRSTIANVLAFNAGNLNLNPSDFAPLHFEQIRGYVIEQFSAIANAKNVVFEFSASSPWLLNAEQQSFLTHVLGNILANALRFTPPGTKIGIAATGDDANAVLTVTDQGTGIGATAISGEGAGEAGHGYGIAIAKRFAALNNLELRWSSPALGDRTERGTVVAIRQKATITG